MFELDLVLDSYKGVRFKHELKSKQRCSHAHHIIEEAVHTSCPPTTSLSTYSHHHTCVVRRKFGLQNNHTTFREVIETPSRTILGHTDLCFAVYQVHRLGRLLSTRVRARTARTGKGASQVTSTGLCTRTHLCLCGFTRPSIGPLDRAFLQRLPPPLVPCTMRSGRADVRVPRQAGKLIPSIAIQSSLLRMHGSSQTAMIGVVRSSLRMSR